MFQDDAEWQVDDHEQQQLRAGQQEAKQIQGSCYFSFNISYFNHSLDCLTTIPPPSHHHHRDIQNKKVMQTDSQACEQNDSQVDWQASRVNLC